MNTLRIRRRAVLAAMAAGCGVTPLLRAAEARRASEVAWLADVQRAPAQLPAGTPHLSSLLVDADGHAITTREQWQAQRARLRRWWLEFLNPLPVPRERPPALEVVTEDRPGNVVRQLVRYESEPGLKVEAYLLKPAGVAKRCPGAVVLHSTSDDCIRQPAGIKGSPEKAFGLKLAERGWVAFCPCNFLWPDAAKIATTKAVESLHQRHPGCKGMAKMLFDAQAALDILAARPEVDPQRLSAVGHSLGGKEVLYLAAFDERVRAAVSSEGGVGTRYSNWDAPWYLGEEIRSPQFAHEHHELLALVAPRAMLLLGGDSADGARSWPFVEAVLPVYRLYGGPARVGLLNHRQGHSVPPEAERHTYEWLETYG